MPALPEYKTRILLENLGVPLVPGVFVPPGADRSQPLPKPPLYLKAQIPGTTSRAAKGLVRRADSRDQVESDLRELLGPSAYGQAEGVLMTGAVHMAAEYYAACMLELGGRKALPGGVLLFSSRGGSGVEERSESLKRVSFSLLTPPKAHEIISRTGRVENPKALGLFLEGLIKTFIRYKLLVLEINPVGVLEDGSLMAIDCRAEFETHAVGKKEKALFSVTPSAEQEPTRLERIVEKINLAEPAGTGFVRENRDPVPEGAFRVATNLCGGGGKMLWEMASGARQDIYSMNESDTSGGLSAFKSYRILRAILALPGAQALLLTGSGMAFQDQYHLAAAVWKALRESPTPLPALLRFGGTAEEKAKALFERVAPDLPVAIKYFESHVFPNAMVHEIGDLALNEPVRVRPPAKPQGPPAFRVDMPPGEFYYYPDKWPGSDPPPCVDICPTNFLIWNPQAGTVEPSKEARCIGCLLCETVSIVHGNGELRIKLDMPEVDQ